MIVSTLFTHPRPHWGVDFKNRSFDETVRLTSSRSQDRDRSAGLPVCPGLPWSALVTDGHQLPGLLMDPPSPCLSVTFFFLLSFFWLLFFVSAMSMLLQHGHIRALQLFIIIVHAHISPPLPTPSLHAQPPGVDIKNRSSDKTVQPVIVASASCLTARSAR